MTVEKLQAIHDAGRDASKLRHIERPVNALIDESEKVFMGRRWDDMKADYKINGEPVNDNDNV